MIEVKDLTKKYGSRSAIQDLSFNLKKGEIVGFLGPNGAGKTTTIKIITGFMAPTSGAVKIAGHDVFENPIEVKKRIGYLPETPPIYGDMLVCDYLEFVAQLKGVEKSKIQKTIEASLEKTLLTEVKNRMIQNLSKGFRQRVGIAQALIGEPDILILDEPTVGLDPRQVAEIRQLLLKLKGQHTILFSTHVLTEVEAICERVIIINKGQIVAQNSIVGLAQNTTAQARKIIVRLKRQPDNLKEVFAQISSIQKFNIDNLKLEVEFTGSDDDLELISNRLFKTGAGVLELLEPAKGLESTFISLTGGHHE